MILFQTLNLAADQDGNSHNEKEEKSQKPTELCNKSVRQDTFLKEIEKSNEAISQFSYPEIISIDTTELNKVK